MTSSYRQRWLRYSISLLEAEDQRPPGVNPALDAGRALQAEVVGPAPKVPRIKALLKEIVAGAGTIAGVAQAAQSIVHLLGIGL